MCFMICGVQLRDLGVKLGEKSIDIVISNLFLCFSFRFNDLLFTYAPGS